jgi:hypothetical protein
MANATKPPDYDAYLKSLKNFPTSGNIPEGAQKYGPVSHGGQVPFTSLFSPEGDYLPSHGSKIAPILYRHQTYNTLRDYITRQFDQTRDFQRQAQDETRRGFGQARRELSRAGEDTRRNLLEREQGLFGHVSQRMASSGLGNTTVMGNLQRGVAADTSRRLQELDNEIARSYSSLALGESAAIVDSLNSIASTFIPQSELMRAVLGDQVADRLGQVRAAAAVTQADAYAYANGSSGQWWNLVQTLAAR